MKTRNQEIKKSRKQESKAEVKKLGEKALIPETAKLIAEGNIVGWFQGRSEWGPRALGNRSILADPRREDMIDILNRKIKMRELFRPFAPSILEEHVYEYFSVPHRPDLKKDMPLVPFMEKVYEIRPEKRKEVPAVTHKDGTGRLQTVSKKQNSIYWSLIEEFYKITGVPIIINTSFNENEPIVNTPEEALDCFLRTKMDVVVLGDCLIKKSRNQEIKKSRNQCG